MLSKIPDSNKLAFPVELTGTEIKVIQLGYPSATLFGVGLVSVNVNGCTTHPKLE
jgi:hypothetical protein